MAQCLLKNGAKIDQVNGFGKTALQLADEYGHREIVLILRYPEFQKGGETFRLPSDEKRPNQRARGETGVRASKPFASYCEHTRPGRKPR